MSIRPFSFEFSPPRSQREKDSLPEAIQAISAHGPQFITVTYGAGGSKKDGTLETLELFKDFTDCALGSHLTHISSTKQELDAYADMLWERGIHHLVALRGDMPQDSTWVRDPDGDYYNYTNEFVAAMAKRHPFDISVGAYPEKHPDAATLSDDIVNLKKKCDAGATRALTQFFFDNDRFYRFRDATTKAGIDVPIVPGLMRVVSFSGIQNFAAKVETSIPQSLKETFAQAADIAATAEDVLQQQVDDLTRNGVDHIHFYTMNKGHGFNRPLQAMQKQP